MNTIKIDSVELTELLEEVTTDSDKEALLVVGEKDNEKLKIGECESQPEIEIEEDFEIEVNMDKLKSLLLIMYELDPQELSITFKSDGDVLIDQLLL